MRGRSGLQRIVRRCLEKDPQERFQSARELVFRARGHAGPIGSRGAGWARKILWPTDGGAGRRDPRLVLSRASRRRLPATVPSAARAAGPRAPRLMLAVLPFESIGGDPEQERFADGMTEEMITVLGRAGPHRLGVIARTSAM